MAYAHVGPIQTINDAWRARRKLWALCRGCGYARKIEPGHLVIDRGDMTLAQLQEKLRCRRCKVRRAAVVLHDVPDIVR
jgi:hypothetical protein